MIDEFSYELGKRAASGGGGGGEAVLIDKTISSNGTYNASSDNADGYKKAVVNVPNSYAAGDEGKVVSNGQLVAQSSDTVAQNGTVDTTLINSLLVNVSGGGYGYTKIAENDFTVNTTSTSETFVGTINCGTGVWTKDKVVYVRIRDKAGVRNGYVFGADAWFINTSAANGSQDDLVLVGKLGAYKKDNKFMQNTSDYGIYPKAMSANGDISIKAKYFSGIGTLNGTYHAEVYLLDWPDGVSPFATS